MIADIYSNNGNWMLNGPEDKKDIFISDDDKKILRELARRLSELAALPIQEEKVKLWTAHNDLKPVRPLFFCDPENGWNEIIRQDMLQCTGKLARQWENYLRKEICWGEEVQDDRVQEAVIYLPWVHHSPSLWGVELNVHESHETGGSYVWEPTIKDFDRDMKKLRYPIIDVDYELSALLMDVAHDVFDGIIEVKRRHKWWHGQTTTRDYVELRGFEQMFMDFFDYPDEMHMLMGFIRDGYMHMIDYLEENNLLSLNTGSAYVGSGGFGFTEDLPAPGFDPEHVRTIDMWDFLDSQETNTVGPEHFAEFVLPYQKEIAERFGLCAYGCCEPLNTRWEHVKTIKNLRRVSVSAWADPLKMAENLGGDYIYSYKPSPSPLARPDFDAEHERDHIAGMIKMCAEHGNHLELIMKDNHTLANKPENLYSWARMVREEINKAYN